MTAVISFDRVLTATLRALVLMLLLGVAAMPQAHAQALVVEVLAITPGGLEEPVEGVWVYAHATGEGHRTDATGQAAFTDAGAGLVSAQKPGYTAALVAATEAADSRLVLRIAAGEVKRDGQVDLVDVAALVDAYGQRPDSTRPNSTVPVFDPAFDYDGDDRVDEDDMAFVAARTGLDGYDGVASTYRLIDDAEAAGAETALPFGSYWETLADITFNNGNSTTSPSSLSRVEPTAGGLGGGNAIAYSYTLGADYQFRFALLRAFMTSSDVEGIDASEYAGIEFWLRGNGVPLVVSFKSGPTSSDFHEYEYAIAEAPAEWTRYRLSFESDFQQPGWGIPQTIGAVVADLQAIQFKASSGQTGEQGEIAVDNLQFFYANEGQASASIAGQVVDAGGDPVPYARVTVQSGGMRRVLADGGGRFVVDAVAGPATVSAARVGFTGDETIVQVTTGETTNATVTLTQTVPAAKPMSTGDVRIEGTALRTDFDGDGAYDPYQVRGASFSVAPIGSFGGVGDNRIFDRSADFLDSLNANTIRTYSGASTYMMDRAEEIGVKVIIGFWVDYAADLSDPGVRENIIAQYRSFVNTHKNHPALLMWTLGNEQNYQNGDGPAWYSLAEELAVAGYEEEGAGYHPVTINNGQVLNVGESAKYTTDAQLPYTDAWATNIYAFDLNTSFFNPYRSLSGKPLVVTEFGIDALDNRNKQEYEQEQADFNVANWNQIDAASSFVIGGTVFEFTDEWWKDGDPNSHDFGGYPTGAHPDGYSNEEWWGLIAVTPDTDSDGLDEWRARAAFQALRLIWAED